MSTTRAHDAEPREGTEPAAEADDDRPRLGLVLGDPAGIGPELVARLLADPATWAAARPVVVGERWALGQGVDIARRSGTPGRQEEATEPPPLPALLEPGEVEGREVTPGHPDAASGRAALGALERALAAVEAGELDGICFAPLNKHALHEAGMGAADELHWLAGRLHHEGPFGEINVLENLWTTRVTSHVPLAEVARLVTREGVLAAIRLAHESLLDAGRAHPRIAVAGLNPHAGDGGLFGREEIDIIGPAIGDARALGIEASGPWPADTVFVRASEGEWDAVVTMYHDQGQVAMKLLGFHRGVTIQGGLQVPITTPAHGTACDIVGRGIANPGAIGAAWALAARMAAARRRRAAGEGQG